MQHRAVTACHACVGARIPTRHRLAIWGGGRRPGPPDTNAKSPASPQVAVKLQVALLACGGCRRQAVRRRLVLPPLELGGLRPRSLLWLRRLLVLAATCAAAGPLTGARWQLAASCSCCSCSDRPCLATAGVATRRARLVVHVWCDARGRLHSGVDENEHAQWCIAWVFGRSERESVTLVKHGATK
jgi:hypothetical protein